MEARKAVKKVLSVADDKGLKRLTKWSGEICRSGPMIDPVTGYS